MIFPKKTRTQPKIHLTALIDIVFLLLVFFLLASSFSRYQAINITVPEVTSEHGELIKEITINIDQQGNITIEQVEMDYSQLLTVLKSQMDIQNQDKIVINADYRVQYDFVAQAIDIANLAGAKTILLVTKRKSSR